MSNVIITIELPEELVERAKNVGVQLEEFFIRFFEDEIRRREAGQHLIEIADQLQALPDDMKPTPAEIEAEIKAYRDEKSKS